MTKAEILAAAKSRRVEMVALREAGQTFAAIAQAYGVNKERARQLVCRGYRHLGIDPRSKMKPGPHGGPGWD